jgi:hypothetical protein
MEVGVEVYRTDVRKWRDYAGNGSGDFTLTLFIDFPQPGVLDRGSYHFDFLELEPIYDDKGHCLSQGVAPGDTEALKEQWRLYGGPEVAEDFPEPGKRGPLLQLSLEPPAWGATRLRRIKGVIEVSAGRWDDLTFRGLAGAAGKPLESSGLVGVRMTPFLLDEADGMTVVLRVVGVTSRLRCWSLENLGKEAHYERRPAKPVVGGEETSCLIRRGTVSPRTALTMTVFLATTSQRYAFDIQDVVLP